MKDKTCKAITKKNTRCIKPPVLKGMCMTHYFISMGWKVRREK